MLSQQLDAPNEISIILDESQNKFVGILRVNISRKEMKFQKINLEEFKELEDFQRYAYKVYVLKNYLNKIDNKLSYCLVENQDGSLVKHETHERPIVAVLDCESMSIVSLEEV